MQWTMKGPLYSSVNSTVLMNRKSLVFIEVYTKYSVTHDTVLLCTVTMQRSCASTKVAAQLCEISFAISTRLPVQSSWSSHIGSYSNRVVLEWSSSVQLPAGQQHSYFA